MRQTVTVTTPASDKTLVSLATAKIALGIKPGDRSRDAAINLAIRHASAACSNYCRRQLRQESITEIVEFEACDKPVDLIVLDRKPVVVASVTIGDDQLLVADDDYRVDAARGTIVRLSNGAPAGWGWPAIRAIGGGWSSGMTTVVYTGGFPSLETVDDGVQRACIQILKSFYYGTAQDPRIRSVNVPDVDAVTYADPGDISSLPLDVRENLNPFRKVL